MLTMVDDPERGFTLGSSDYATKPVNRQRLSTCCSNTPAPPALSRWSWTTTIGPRSLRAILEKEGWAGLRGRERTGRARSMENDVPSLIFLDLSMPEMDGFEFAAAVRHIPNGGRSPSWS